MAELIEALTAKFAAQEPVLDVLAGIRQESELDAETELSFSDVDEMDKHIAELLVARESDVLVQLSCGRFPFPTPSELWHLGWPSRSVEQRAALHGYMLQTAAEALEKYVLGDLYLKASNRNPGDYMPKALFFLGDKTLAKKGDADLTVDKVLKNILAMGQPPEQPVRPPSNVMRSSTMKPGTRPDDESEYYRDLPTGGRRCNPFHTIEIDHSEGFG